MRFAGINARYVVRNTPVSVAVRKQKESPSRRSGKADQAQPLRRIGMDPYSHPQISAPDTRRADSEKPCVARPVDSEEKRRRRTQAPGTAVRADLRCTGRTEPKSPWWQADETRWNVFETTKTKATYKRYPWVFVSRESVVYVVDPTRATDVIESHLGRVVEGILLVDRYSA